MTAQYTRVEVDKILDGRLHSFIESIADTTHTSVSPQAITAGVEYRYTNDKGQINKQIHPDYLEGQTWDSTNNKQTFEDELNTPVYVMDLKFTFDPSVSASGIVTIKAYIDEDTPFLISSSTAPYKGSPEQISKLIDFYIGDDTGYDTKNNGVYFTLTFDANGDLYDKSHKLYRT